MANPDDVQKGVIAQAMATPQVRTFIIKISNTKLALFLHGLFSLARCLVCAVHAAVRFENYEPPRHPYHSIHCKYCRTILCLIHQFIILEHNFSSVVSST